MADATRIVLFLKKVYFIRFGATQTLQQWINFTGGLFCFIIGRLRQKKMSPLLNLQKVKNNFAKISYAV